MMKKTTVLIKFLKFYICITKLQLRRRKKIIVNNMEMEIWIFVQTLNENKFYYVDWNITPYRFTHKNKIIIERSNTTIMILSSVFLFNFSKYSINMNYLNWTKQDKKTTTILILY